jgi:hypothetical protein
MASCSIFDDDRRATPDFFHMQSPDPLEVSMAYGETNASAKPKDWIDHDTNNFREGLWSFTGQAKLDVPEKASVDDKIAPQHVLTKSALERWYWRYNSDGTRQKVPFSRKQRFEQAPFHEQVHDGYKVWNVSTKQQVEAVDITPPLSSSDPNDWGSRSSSLSINETISEEHRKIVARKQYYDRSGLLWECASMLLEVSSNNTMSPRATPCLILTMIQNISLHPTNLTEYEFVKLVCLQGDEIFQWLSTNYSYLVDRAETQWHQASSLLINNAGLDGLNANFMDDFLWMDVEDQVSFIKAYKRLQLEAMTLREGVMLPKTELDALCMMPDEDKLAAILVYKNEAVQTSLQMLHSLNCKEATSDEEQGPSSKVDNLYLKFLYGLGSEKHDTFQDLVGLPHLASSSEPVIVLLAENNNSSSVSDVGKHTVQSKVVFDVQRTSETSNSTSEASNTNSSATTVSIFNVSKSEDLSKHDSPLGYIFFDASHHLEAEVPHFSEVETLDVGLRDLPQLERHKVSYNDLRGLASTIRLRGHTSSYSENHCDEGSDWDFKPSKSLRKKVSTLFGAFKKPFTFSKRKENRPTVKDYFD